MGTVHSINAGSIAVDALRSEDYISGRRAGLGGQPSSLDQGQPGSQQRRDWNAGWRSGADELARIDAARIDAARIAARPCAYINGKTCECGGRGHCLDVA